MSWKSLVASLLLVLSTGSFGLAEKPKKVLLLGDKGSHGPGSHEHMPGLRILAKCLHWRSRCTRPTGMGLTVPGC